MVGYFNLPRFAQRIRRITPRHRRRGSTISAPQYDAAVYLVRADARKREWFASDGVGMPAASRAPLNKALGHQDNSAKMKLHESLVRVQLASTLRAHDEATQL